jgi:hypothetical protein
MGWLDKYKDGGSFDGLTNKGFNYNGAWGGQFQDGGDIVKYKGSLPVNPEITESPNVQRPFYDPRLDRINMPLMYDMMPNAGDIINHEAYHSLQHKEGRDNFDIAHNTPDKLWAMMQKRPQLPVTDAEYYKFHNRKPIESQMDIARFKAERPSTQFVPDDILWNKFVDERMYDNPHNIEGEAKYYEDTGKEFHKMQGGGGIPGSVGFTYARTGAPSNGKFAKKTMASAQSGMIIDDEMGQWRHPGEITRINSNNITMEGVDYPVLGISDKGDKKLMQPGKNYKFKGKRVTEFPMAEDGNQLTKLDQLTNFTNYNTPQPGGWLDKYNK